MTECVFCKIVKNKLKAYRVYEDKDVLAIAPLKKTILSKRQLLLMPKKHYENIYTIPNKELCNLIKATKKISLKMRKLFDAEGINILHASGKAAQQSVFHIHFHLIPRYKHDNIDAWPHNKYVEHQYLQIYKNMNLNE